MHKNKTFSTTGIGVEIFSLLLSINNIVLPWKKAVFYVETPRHRVNTIAFWRACFPWKPCIMCTQQFGDNCPWGWCIFGEIRKVGTDYTDNPNRPLGFLFFNPKTILQISYNTVDKVCIKKQLSHETCALYTFLYTNILTGIHTQSRLTI